MLNSAFYHISLSLGRNFKIKKMIGKDHRISVTSTAVLFVSTCLLIICTHVRLINADCGLVESERLGCLGWWKWDTQSKCRERGCCTSPASQGVEWCYYPKARANVTTTVHVIQGCHLDVGFANTSVDIVNLWFSKHLPLAAKVGGELANRNSSARLQFTAPAWIVSLFLQCPPLLPIACPDSATRQLVLDGIRKGYITWHAFPFNVEMEFMDPSIIEFGVKLVHQLDDLYVDIVPEQKKGVQEGIIYIYIYIYICMYV